MNNICVERASDDSFKIEVEGEETIFLFEDELEKLYYIIGAVLEDKYRCNDDYGFDYQEDVYEEA